MAGAQVISEYNDCVLTRSYAYGRNKDEPIATWNGDASETLYYHQDHRYSVEAITNANGAVVERYGYSSHGKTVVLDGSGNEISADARVQPFVTTGRRCDNETQLYYFRARYFDSELGRFIARDPLGYVDGYSIYRGYFVPGGLDPNGLWKGTIKRVTASGAITINMNTKERSVRSDGDRRYLRIKGGDKNARGRLSVESLSHTRDVTCEKEYCDENECEKWCRSDAEIDVSAHIFYRGSGEGGETHFDCRTGRPASDESDMTDVVAMNSDFILNHERERAMQFARVLSANLSEILRDCGPCKKSVGSCERFKREGGYSDGIKDSFDTSKRQFKGSADGMPNPVDDPNGNWGTGLSRVLIEMPVCSLAKHRDFKVATCK